MNERSWGKNPEVNQALDNKNAVERLSRHGIYFLIPAVEKEISLLEGLLLDVGVFGRFFLLLVAAVVLFAAAVAARVGHHDLLTVAAAMALAALVGPLHTRYRAVREYLAADKYEDRVLALRDQLYAARDTEARFCIQHGQYDRVRILYGVPETVEATPPVAPEPEPEEEEEDQEQLIFEAAERLRDRIKSALEPLEDEFLVDWEHHVQHVARLTKELLELLKPAPPKTET